MKLPVQFRTMSIEKQDAPADSRNVKLSFSSEAPYQRSFGVEILDHQPQSVDLSRLNDGAPLLLNHDTEKQVGVVEQAGVGDGKGSAEVRFGKSAFAEEIFRDVKDGIRRKVSVAYRVLDMIEEKAESEAEKVFRVVNWQPLEISIVGIPADNTVGVGREAELKAENEVKVTKLDEPAKAEGTAQSNAKSASPDEAAAKTAEAGKSVPESKQPQQATIQVKETKMPENAIDLVAAERARVQEILAVGEKCGCLDEARIAVRDGKSEHEFKDWVLKEKFKAVPAPSPEIGMSEKEIGQWSLLDGVRQLADRKQVSGIIKEASDAAAKVYGKPARGFYIPYDVQKRDATIGTTTTGGYTGTSKLGSFVDALDNAMVVVKAGATVLRGLSGNTALYLPRATAHATSYYVSEAGGLTEGQWTLAQVALTPKIVGAYTEITRQLLLQSSFDAENLVRNDLMKSTALAIDLAALYGNPSGTTTLATQPIGILNNTTITRTSLGTTCLGDIPTYSDMIGMQTTVGTANGFGEKMCYITNHTIRGKLKTTASSTAIAGLGFVCQRVDGEDQIDGFPLYVTNQIPTTIPLPSTTLGATGSGIVFGDMSQLLIGFWGQDVLVDPYTVATSGLTRVIVFTDFDVAPRQPGAFVRVTDALASTT
jgi:HK97 family phage major capsid protein